MNENLSKQIDHMLEVWARWALSGYECGLGYSRLSNLGWIMENGGIVIRSTGPKYPPENPVATEMDRWICDLRREKPTEGDMLVMYCLNGFHKENIARKHNISVRMVEVRLKTAKTWLECVLMIKKRYKFS